jgi:hypothetical protein
MVRHRLAALAIDGHQGNLDALTDEWSVPVP